MSTSDKVDKLFDQLQQTARVQAEQKASKQRKEELARSTAKRLLDKLRASGLSAEDALNAAYGMDRLDEFDSMVIINLTNMLYEGLGEPDPQ